MDDVERLRDKLHRLVNEHATSGFPTFGEGYTSEVILRELKNIKNEKGSTALHVMASFDLNLNFGWLLQRLIGQQRYELLKVKDNSGNLPIHCAAGVYNGEVKVLKDMLEYWPIDARVQLLQIQNVKGATALHCAALDGHTSSMKDMIEGISDVIISELLHIRNEEGNTAVFEGLRNGKAIPVGMEKHITGDLLTSAHGNILHCIALDGEIKAVGKKEAIKNLPDLITAGELFNLMKEKNESGRTPMHCVMLQHDVEVAKAMLTIAKEHYGTDKCMELLMERDDNGDTPVHCAADAGRTGALEWVRDNFKPEQKKTLVNMKNRMNPTAVQTVIETATAVKIRLDETIELLTEFNNYTDETTT